MSFDPGVPNCFQMLFVAQITAVTGGNYTFAEQMIQSDGSYAPVDCGRTGTNAVEINGNTVSVPQYVWMRFKGIVGGDAAYEFDCPTGTFPSVISTPISFTGDVTFDDGVEYTSSAVTTFDSGSNTTFDSGSTVNLNGTTTNGSSSTVTYSSGSNVTYNSGSTLTNNGTTTNNGNTTNSSSSTTTNNAGSTTTNNGTFNSSGGNLIIPTSVPGSPVAGNIYSSSGNIVLYSSPTASQTWPAPATVPTWQKFTMTNTMFTASALTQTVTIGTLPAQLYVTNGYVTVDTNFTGGGLTGFTFFVQVNGNSISANTDCFGTTTGNLTNLTSVRPSLSGSTNLIEIEGNSTGADVNAATAGLMTIWLLVSYLP